jgi:aquaporin Z
MLEAHAGNVSPPDPHTGPAVKGGTERAAATSEPRAGWHWVAWGCELAGTAILVLAGLSAVCLDFGRGSPVAAAVPSASVRLLITGTLFAGSGSLVAVSPIGRVSGAHLNPSVTLGFWLTGNVHRHDLAGYTVFQVVGALLGALLLHLLWGPTVLASVGEGLTLPGPGTTALQAVLLEMLMTAVLLVTIFVFVSHHRLMRWTPLAVWVVVALLVWQGAPHTGTSLNPARSLGPAVASGGYADLWIYVVGPLGAAVVVGGLTRAGSWHRLMLTARLFEDPRYGSAVRHLTTLVTRV